MCLHIPCLETKVCSRAPVQLHYGSYSCRILGKACETLMAEHNMHRGESPNMHRGCSSDLSHLDVADEMSNLR